MTRRELLGMIIKSGIALPILGNSIDLFAGDLPLDTSKNLPPIKERIIVMLRLFGGNDGLNTLVPYNDPLYYKYRKEESIINCSIDERQVIKPSKFDSFGFHPQCADFNEIFSDGKMAIINNVGYPHQDLSHFRSTDIWLSGTDSHIYELSGWLGRYLEMKYPNYLENVPDFPPAIEFGTSVSRILLGKNIPMGFAYLGENYIPDDEDVKGNKLTKTQIEQNYILNIKHQSHKYLKKLNEIEKNKIPNAEKYPENNYIANYLSHTARLIKSGLQSNIYVINTLNMFDNHEYLLDYQATGLKLVSQAVGAFQRDLDKLGIADRVITVLYSEFSRRVIPNGTGTDHGAAGPMLIIGNNVQGGLYGNSPNLADLDANGNLKYEYDFRQIYTSLLSDWFEEDYSLIYPYIISHNMEKIHFLNTNVKAPKTHIYPNPCNNQFTLSIEFSKIESVEIFDMKGIKIENTKIIGLGTLKLVIDTSNISTGIYYVIISSYNQKIYDKFVKV